MKTCSCCCEAKPLDDFYADKSRSSGRSSRCKPCVIGASRRRQQVNPEKHKDYLRGYYRNNLARAKQTSAERYAKNGDAIRAGAATWRRANPSKCLRYAARYRQANPQKRAALIAKYRTAQLRRTPPWLNRAHFAEIEGAYHFAKVMERITGQKHHVDHVEPLQGADVSGLHVPWNLQVIPARENFAKGNRRIEVYG